MKESHPSWSQVCSGGFLRWNMKANLQDAEQMKEFLKYFKEEYGAKKDDTRVAADKKHRPRVRHMQVSTGE